jgi:hypothetical protein
MSGLRVGSYHFPVWLVIVIMVGIGSMTISGADFVDPTFNGTLIETDVPNAKSNTFTGVPVHFDTTNPLTLTASGNGAKAGAKVITSQQLRIDLLAQVADPVTITIPIRNQSDDSSIILVKVTADSSILTDVREGFSTTGVRLVGANQWLMTVNDNANADFKLDVVGLQGGAFFLLVEIKALS